MSWDTPEKRGWYLRSNNVFIMESSWNSFACFLSRFAAISHRREPWFMMLKQTWQTLGLISNTGHSFSTLIGDKMFCGSCFMERLSHRALQVQWMEEEWMFWSLKVKTNKASLCLFCLYLRLMHSFALVCSQKFRNWGKKIQTLGIWSQLFGLEGIDWHEKMEKKQKYWLLEIKLNSGHLGMGTWLIHQADTSPHYSWGNCLLFAAFGDVNTGVSSRCRACRVLCSPQCLWWTVVFKLPASLLLYGGVGLAWCPTSHPPVLMGNARHVLSVETAYCIWGLLRLRVPLYLDVF